jgi:hypothetical protein
MNPNLDDNILKQQIIPTLITYIDVVNILNFY